MRLKFWKKKPHVVTLLDFISHVGLCSEENQQKYMDILQQQGCPYHLLGVPVPDNLNGLTYGQLDDLRSCASEEDPMAMAENMVEAVVGKKVDIANEDVNKVFGFINWVKREIERINKLFASMKPVYTSEEKAAGVEELDFGSFGVLDWYAKRMGITNQNDVRSVAWVRIYMCMKNDHEQQLYERRLQDVYMKKH